MRERGLCGLGVGPGKNAEVKRGGDGSVDFPDVFIRTHRHPGSIGVPERAHVANADACED
jgi:hypothetical protein